MLKKVVVYFNIPEIILCSVKSIKWPLIVQWLLPLIHTKDSVKKRVSDITMFIYQINRKKHFIKVFDVLLETLYFQNIFKGFETDIVYNEKSKADIIFWKTVTRFVLIL